MKEAMKLALESLELMYACYAHPEWISHKQQEEKILAQCAATTMTLRQALAKQEQCEPVAHCEAGSNYCWKCLEEAKPTYGSEEIRKLREVIASQAKIIEDHIPDVKKMVEQEQSELVGNIRMCCGGSPSLNQPCIHKEGCISWKK